MIRKLSKVLTVILLTTFTSGCGVYMAAHQPDAKNVSLFKTGTPRALLLAEFGLPTLAETRDGRKYEIYKFVQGYSGGAKAGRAVFHGAADVVTLGLWEIVATPTESVFDGDNMAYQVRYDDTDHIDEVVLLKQS